MADLTTHYKERTPEETVQIIKDFFNQNGFTLKETDLNQSEAGTWYCHVDCFKNDVNVCGANGKGMTTSYSLASGYAELYERFCNQINFMPSLYWGNLYMDRNYAKNGYYWTPDEKIMTYEETLNCCGRAKDYVYAYCRDDEELTRAMMSAITDNRYVGVPWSNIDDSNDKIYIDPRFSLRICRSNGMAAGNTLDEALAQGLSELVEREGEYWTFKNFEQPHYALKLENINNSSIQEKIKNIKALGYEFYLFDLSYNCHLPVIMSLLVDRDSGILNMNFGAFPVFDIAAERVITELYQGIQTYKSSSFQGRLQQPYKVFQLSNLLITYGNAISGEIFPACFFDHIEYKDYYNKEVFVDKDYTNKAIVKYFAELAKSLGTKFYYIDKSLSPDIKAIQVIIESTEQYKINYVIDSNPMVWDNTSKEVVLQVLSDYTKLFRSIKDQTPVDIPNLVNLIRTADSYGSSIQRLLDNTFLWHFTLATKHDIGFQYLQIFLDPFNSFIDNVPNDLVGSEVFKAYKKYTQLLLYIKFNIYSTQELLYIFNNIFNYNISEKDIENCTSLSYLLQRAYIEPLSRFIHGPYLEIIDTFINNSPS